MTYSLRSIGLIAAFALWGSARVAPPDSLRFDVAGPFGAGAAAAAVIGDQPLWAEPPDAVKKLVPNYPLMWAMFGIARQPEARNQLLPIMLLGVGLIEALPIITLVFALILIFANPAH